MDAAKIERLQQFVNNCNSDPSILNDPSLSFLRTWIESLGGKVPSSSKHKETESKPYVVDEDKEEEEDEILESDIKFEGETVEPDNDPPQKMGDSSVEVSDENRYAAQQANAKAMKAFHKGKFEEAVEHFTESILLNPSSGLTYAARSTAYLKMNKPNAATRDYDAAMKMTW